MTNSILPTWVLTAALLLAAAPAGAGCTASFYGAGERLNRHTANGERFQPMALTAAHRSLPFGTKVRVSHGERYVVVRINDRGPAKWTGRCIDLSKGAAKALGITRKGIARVKLDVLR